MRGGGLSGEARTVIAMGMAGLRGSMWSSGEEATVGSGEPEKRCREDWRMERVWDDRGYEGRCVMECQVPVRAILAGLMLAEMSRGGSCSQCSRTILSHIMELSCDYFFLTIINSLSRICY